MKKRSAYEVYRSIRKKMPRPSKAHSQSKYTKADRRNQGKTDLEELLEEKEGENGKSL